MASILLLEVIMSICTICGKPATHPDGAFGEVNIVELCHYCGEVVDDHSHGNPRPAFSMTYCNDTCRRRYHYEMSLSEWTPSEHWERRMD